MVVSRAPEPSNINWDNVELPWSCVTMPPPARAPCGHSRRVATHHVGVPLCSRQVLHDPAPDIGARHAGDHRCVVRVHQPAGHRAKQGQAREHLLGTAVGLCAAGSHLDHQRPHSVRGAPDGPVGAPLDIRWVAPHDFAAFVELRTRTAHRVGTARLVSWMGRTEGAQVSQMSKVVIAQVLNSVVVLIVVYWSDFHIWSVAPACCVVHTEAVAR